MNKKKKEREGMFCLLVFLAALLPRLWMSLSAVPLKTFSDEVATIVSAPYLAGYDWSQVVSHAGYYGQGFHFIFAPLFMITDNPVLIYRVVLAVYAVLQAGVAPICYHLMRRYYGVEERKFAIAASIASSYLIVTRPTLFFNENSMVLCVWLAAWLMLKLQECLDHRWKKRGYTCLLMILLSYTLLLHTRMIALWIGLCFVTICYWLKNRQWLISRSCFLFAGVPGYICSKELVHFIQDVIWKTGTGNSVANTAIYLNTSVPLTSPRTWKAWLSIILGQLQTLNLFTAGLGILCICIVVTVLIQLFKKDSMVKEEKKLFQNNTILFLLFGSCAVMTMIGQSITWLGDMSLAISHGPNSTDYGLKAVIYLRYFAVYLGPVFMGCLCWMKCRQEDTVRLLKYASIILTGLILYWVVVILPFAYENPFTMEFFYTLSAYQIDQPVALKNYMIGVVWMILMPVITYYMLKQKKMNQMLIVAGCFMALLSCGNSIRYEINREQHNMGNINAGYAYVKELEETGKKVPEQIYCYDGSDKTDHQSYFGYQFVLNRYEIIPAFEKDGSDIPDGAMVFTNVPMGKEFTKRGFKEKKLDSNEYLYRYAD